MPEKPILVIGDCHGIRSRLEKLLRVEGIIDAEGKRVNHDVTVLQLGDLGDFRHNTFEEAQLFKDADEWIDHFLWGNHERPVFDLRMPFGGYCKPHSETEAIMSKWIKEGRLTLAYAAHGFLITHAGLPPFVTQATRKRAPKTLAAWINSMERVAMPDNENYLEVAAFAKLRDSIGYDRGGWHAFGGILWRDAREKLYGGVRQVFGHSSHEHACQFLSHAGTSYCVDTSKHGGLAAIWLPEERIVEVTDDPAPSEPSLA